MFFSHFSLISRNKINSLNLARKISILKSQRHSSTWADINQSFSSSSIVKYSMENLIHFHECLHIPWFVEISLVTFLARSLIAFPLTISQRKVLQRYDALRPEILKISENLKVRLKKESYLLEVDKRKLQRLYLRMLRKETKRLIERDNCHPVKASFLVLFQVPMWFTLSHSYRNLATLRPNPDDPTAILAQEQLKNEGCLWFHDLTMPDPTGVLPVINCIINLINIQMHVNERKRNKLLDSFFTRIITNGSRLLCIILVPIGLIMPADMSFYWCVSSVLGLVQNILLINPKMKKILNLETKSNEKKI